MKLLERLRDQFGKDKSDLKRIKQIDLICALRAARESDNFLSYAIYQAQYKQLMGVYYEPETE